MVRQAGNRSREPATLGKVDLLPLDFQQQSVATEQWVVNGQHDVQSMFWHRGRIRGNVCWDQRSLRIRKIPRHHLRKAPVVKKRVELLLELHCG